MEQLMKQMEIVNKDVGMRWEKVILKTVAKISAGQSAPKDSDFSVKDGLPFIRAGHLEQLIAGKNIFSLPTINKEHSLKNRLKVLNKGSILFAKSGMSAMLNRVYLVEQEIYYVSHLASVTPDDSVLDSRFCYYFLKHFKTSKLIKDSAYPSIGLPDIEKVEIPLPPLPIQKRIAEILDAADALKRKDQELLKKYDELAQAIFIDMFGDPVTNEKGWEVKRLGELFSNPVKCGPFGSALKKEEYVKQGIPVWIMDNIQDYNFNEIGCLYIYEEKYLDLTSYSASNGDIIISRAGTVGKMCVIDSKFEKSIISTNLIKISLNDKLLNPYFFVKLMKYFGKKIGRLRTGSENGFTHMNTGVLAGLEFPLPPIKKQNEFIKILENINNQTRFLETKPEKLFNSLMQKAFNGELVAE